ncbi:MAG: RNA polymerase sigma factor [Verrucomicrobiota bacterium]
MPRTTLVVFQKGIDNLSPENADEATLAIYLAHRPTLVNYAKGIVGIAADAEDIAQEAWLRFNASSVDPQKPECVSYLYRTVKHLAIDRLRSRSRESKLIQFEPSGTTGALAEERVLTENPIVPREELRLFQEAVAELPPVTQQAIRMKRVEGLKLKEISERLNLSITRVHTLIREGVEHCRRKVRL